MDDPLTLIGFRHSVYTRIVRMMLIEVGLEAAYIEVDPFSTPPDPALADHMPFGRVPVLRHGAFTLTETSVIAGYLNTLSARPVPVPKTPQAHARMQQVIGIVDAYGYQPMVRDVFSHGFYRQLLNQQFDPERVTLGLERSRPVLDQLNRIAEEGLQLDGRDISVADIHLAPMMAYFTKVGRADALLAAYPALSTWWRVMKDHSSLVATDPFTIS